MFKKKLRLYLIVFLPLMGLWIYQIAFLHTCDIPHYQSMIQEKELASSNPSSPTNQHRKKVRKDIWFSQSDTSRLHYQIASEGSMLTLTPVKNKFEVVESLQGIKCWMQDKLMNDGASNSPMQQTRLIEAENGLYRYTTQEFTANGVLLSLFRLPGHVLPKDPVEKDKAFLHGVAHDISFLFGGKTPQFQAEQFEATMVRE